MVYAKSNTEMSYQDDQRRRFQVVYVQKMEERRVFMEGLAEFRNKTFKYHFKQLKASVGPKWYHTLSVNQRYALDQLQRAIYQDSLEDQPNRMKAILNTIGLYPMPRSSDLMAALHGGQGESMQTIVYLYKLLFSRNFTDVIPVYSLNAKLMLSSLYYVGLEDILKYLEDTYKSDAVEKPPKPKRKRKPGPPPASPYLEKLLVKCYNPHKKRVPKRPPPMPNVKLDYIIQPVPPKPTVPPPAPEPKPSKPRDECDEIAGVMKFQPFTPISATPFKVYASRMPRKRAQRLSRDKYEKVQPKKEKKPSNPPVLPLEQLQHNIIGMYTVDEKRYYVLGNVVQVPSKGILIHGGHSFVDGEYMPIHSGVYWYDREVETEKPPCDCLDRWGNRITDYVTASKCMCKHFYDFHHKSNTFPSTEVPYFEKPTKKAPYHFNYAQIYELDPSAIYIGREFKRIWESESMLQHGSEKDVKAGKKKPLDDNLASSTCLGEHPQPDDYLKCAIEAYIHNSDNLAARLPDVCQAPELKEWIRRRLYGNFTRQQKKEMMLRTQKRIWSLKIAADRGLGHMYPPFDSYLFCGSTTWANKRSLRERFSEYSKNYIRNLYTCKVNSYNMLWASMFHEQFPDKNFRQIFFSYLFERTSDMNLIHPYDAIEVKERARVMENARHSHRCM